MAYRFKAYEKAVGFFVTVAVAIIIFIATYVISINQLEKMNRVEYYTVFDRGDYFQNKAITIKYNGFEIGKTKSALLLENDRVKVSFFINADFTNRIKSNCVLKLNMSLLPGGESIALIPGTANSVPLEPGMRLYSSDEAVGRRLLLSSKMHEKLPPNPLDQIVVTLNGLVKQLAAEDGPVTGILLTLEGLLETMDRLLYDLNDPDSDLKQILAQVNRTLSVLNNKDSMFYEMTHSKKMYNDIITTLNTLEKSLSELEVVLKNLQTVRLLGGEKDRNK